MTMYAKEILSNLISGDTRFDAHNYCNDDVSVFTNSLEEFVVANDRERDSSKSQTIYTDAQEAVNAALKLAGYEVATVKPTFTAKMELSEEVLEILVAVANARQFEFFNNYNKNSEDYAPAADLCSTVFNEYVTDQCETCDDYAKGQTGRILSKLKLLNQAA